MDKILFLTLLLASLIQVIRSDCPDKGDQILKSFDEAYQDFKNTVCKKCDGKVGENQDQLKWIEEILFNAVLSKDVFGVDVPVSIFQRARKFL